MARSRWSLVLYFQWNFDWYDGALDRCHCYCLCHWKAAHSRHDLLLLPCPRSIQALCFRPPLAPRPHHCPCPRCRTSRAGCWVACRFAAFWVGCFPSSSRSGVNAQKDLGCVDMRQAFAKSYTAARCCSYRSIISISSSWQ